MTKIIDQLDDMVQQSIHALTAIYPHLSQLDDLPIVFDNQFNGQSIPILSGGGSGHEPAHFGYVGDGMLSAAISGQIFVPPHADEILAAIKQLHQGRGVFVIIKNFDADIREFSAAIAQARQAGIPVKYIISHDDISVETSNFHVRHRGVAGTILLHKILGEAAKRGASLDELESIAFSLSTSMATLGVATRPACIPGEQTEMFHLKENEISFGIGIHGEPGYRKTTFLSSEHLANELVNKLKLHFKWKEEDEYVLLINNLGATSKLEELIFSNDVLQLLELEGLRIPFVKTGHLITSLDMAGLSVTLCKVESADWLDFLTSPTNAFAW